MTASRYGGGECLLQIKRGENSQKQGHLGEPREDMTLSQAMQEDGEREGRAGGSGTKERGNQSGWVNREEWPSPLRQSSECVCRGCQSGPLTGQD